MKLRNHVRSHVSITLPAPNALIAITSMGSLSVASLLHQGSIALAAPKRNLEGRSHEFVILRERPWCLLLFQ